MESKRSDDAVGIEPTLAEIAARVGQVRGYLAECQAIVDELFPPARVKCPECNDECYESDVRRYREGPYMGTMNVVEYPCGHKSSTRLQAWPLANDPRNQRQQPD